jgi:hypothetical protein
MFWRRSCHGTFGRSVHRVAWRKGFQNAGTPIDFLVNGQRVELNAMTSDQFLDFVEDKLVAAGIEKIVPPRAIHASCLGKCT